MASERNVSHRRALAVGVGLLFALGLLAAPAGAAMITVNTTGDEFNTGAGCSLREAVEAANTNGAFGGCPAGDGGTDTIKFSAPATYALAGATNEDSNASGDLDVTAGGPLVVSGWDDGAGTPAATIDGSGGDRIFDLQPDVDGPVDLKLEKLTLTHGAVTGSGNGGAVRVADPDGKLATDFVRVMNNDAGGDGGGIAFEDGVVGARFSLAHTEVGHNNADGEGGGIWLDLPDDPTTDPSVTATTIDGNTAGEMGGGIYLATRAIDGIQLFLTNTTLAGNQAQLAGGGLAFDQAEGANAYFRFSTIAMNSTAAAGAGGGVYSTDGSNDGQFLLFTGSIIAGNTAANLPSNCAGPANTSGSGTSIESTNSCGLNSLNSVVDANPLLGPLTYDVGAGVTNRTPTMRLYTGSQALDFVASCSAAGGFDERGIARPQGSACDAGAFEGDAGAAPDSDGDGLDDPHDNCPADSNATQANNDGDVQGDVCDLDDDNDGVLDASDNCPTTVGVPSNAGCPAPPPSTTQAATAPATVVKKCKKKKKRAASAAKRKKCRKKKR